MRRIDRFDNYMKTKGLNDNKVTVQLGLSIGTLGKSRKEGRDLSNKVLNKILDFYTDLDRVWLLTGEGEMLKGSTVQTTYGDNSPNINGNDINIATSETAVLKERIKALEAVLAEKERLIKLYEKILENGIK